MGLPAKLQSLFVLTNLSGVAWRQGSDEGQPRSRQLQELQQLPDVGAGDALLPAEPGPASGFASVEGGSPAGRLIKPPDKRGRGFLPHFPSWQGDDNPAAKVLAWDGVGAPLAKTVKNNGNSDCFRCFGWCGTATARAWNATNRDGT